MLAFHPSRRTGKSNHARLSAVHDRVVAGAPMTGAWYLRLRRQAAGLSRHEVARQLHALALRAPHDVSIAGSKPDLREALALVDLLETNGTRARHRVTITALAAIYPLDVDTYFQLLEQPAERHPSLCQLCGAGLDERCRDNPFCGLYRSAAA